MIRRYPKKLSLLRLTFMAGLTLFLIGCGANETAQNESKISDDQTGEYTTGGKVDHTDSSASKTIAS